MNAVTTAKETRRVPKAGELFKHYAENEHYCVLMVKGEGAKAEAKYAAIKTNSPAHFHNTPFAVLNDAGPVTVAVTRKDGSVYQKLLFHREVKWMSLDNMAGLVNDTWTKNVFDPKTNELTRTVTLGPKWEPKGKVAGFGG